MKVSKASIHFRRRVLNTVYSWADEDHHWRRHCYYHYHHRRLSGQGDTPLSLPFSHTTPLCPAAPHLTFCAVSIGLAEPLLFYIYARSPNSHLDSNTVFGADFPM